ncbi:Bacterial shufflon protein%2C N-terminal constant region [Shigella sonnei]|nr:Bacterial shufflon protein%2C N-terminal constant region [Shigella sonnei]
MSDGSWVRSVNNKGIYTGGQVKGGTVRADGRLYTGEYLQLENVLQVAAEYAPHELVTYGLPGHSHQPITHGRLRAIQPKIRMVQ